MCLQTIYYIYATKGEITGMIARAMVILSINVRSRTLRQPRSRYMYVLPKHVSFSNHSIPTPYSLSEDSSKQTSKSGSKMKLSP